MSAMGKISAGQRNVYWIGGTFLAILGFVFAEGSLIATTKLMGPLKATLLRILFTIPLSWLVIYLSATSSASRYVRGWIAKKEKHLSDKVQMAVKSGKFIAVFNTAVFLGPIVASILMLMLGVKVQRAYAYSVLCAILCAGSWCTFYSGMFWGWEKILLGR